MMKHNRLAIRIWLTMAVTAVPLALASSASAMLDATTDPGGSTGATHAPVVASSRGFNWGSVATGVAVAVAVTLVAIALAYVARNRSRVATAH